MNRKYTAEHIDYITDNIKGRSYQDLTNMFNARFDMKLKISTMISLASRHGLRNERNCRFNTGWEPTQFKKGHVPFNKGKKGVGGWEPTQFKKGNKPANYKPVGTERTNVDGYVEIKITDPNKWRSKHIVIWETVNGPIPKGHVVIFADRNNLNFELDNLILVSRKQLLELNRYKLIQEDKELTKTAINIVDLKIKISDMKKSIRWNNKACF